MIFKKRFKLGKTKKGGCCAVIVAAGSSQRMDGVDKIFAELAGETVLAHTLRAFENSNSVDEIVVVAKNTELERVANICKQCGIDKAKSVVAGGRTRLSSVINGINAASRTMEFIAIHDGARPCVSGDIIKSTVSAAQKYHAAAPAVPVVSTLKYVEKGTVIKTVDRTGLYEIQTPQVFEANLIKAALKNAADNAENVTDDCMAAEALGVKIHITEGSRVNIKLTTKEDLLLARALLCKGDTVK